MKKAAYIIIPILLFIFLECRKEDDGVYRYAVHGSLYKDFNQDCNAVPYSGATMKLLYSYRTLLDQGNYVLLGTYITGSDGHFFIPYAKLKGSGELRLIIEEHSFWIAPSESIYLDIILDEVVPVVIHLETDSTYSSSDTLYYATTGDGLKSSTLIGPFANGTIDTIYMSDAFQPTGSYTPNHQRVKETSLLWGLGYKEYKKALDSSYYSSSSFNLVKFTPKWCDDPIPVEVVVSLN